MRVIAGKARRLELKTAPGMDTRPTQDRIKETLFNMIQYEVPGANFLDLFAGSGAMGIEALSRGALHATFVELAAEPMKYIKENLRFTKLADDADTMQTSAVAAVNTLAGRGMHYHIVFMDPPYRKDLEKEVLAALQNSPIIDSDTLIIVEAALDTRFDYLEEFGYTAEKIKTYKTNQHLFLRRNH